MSDRDVMRQALEALDSGVSISPGSELHDRLRAALAREPAEGAAVPVAAHMLTADGSAHHLRFDVAHVQATARRMNQRCVLLYAAPPAKREPISAERLQSLMADHFGGRELTDDEAASAEAFARAIERAHNITGA